LDDWVDDIEEIFGDHTLCDELFLMMIFAWIQGLFPFIAIAGSFCCTKKESRVSICGIGLPSLICITSAIIYLLMWFDDSRKSLLSK